MRAWWSTSRPAALRAAMMGLSASFTCLRGGQGVMTKGLQVGQGVMTKGRQVGRPGCDD